MSHDGIVHNGGDIHFIFDHFLFCFIIVDALVALNSIIHHSICFILKILFNGSLIDVIFSLESSVWSFSQPTLKPS